MCLVAHSTVQSGASALCLLPPDLTKGSALSWGGGVSSGFDALLLDEDRGWLLVGGRDHIYLLRPDSLELLAPSVRSRGGR